MSTVTYFITKPCGSQKVALWPMSTYGEVCTSQSEAEAKLAELAGKGKKGSKFSLEMQKIVLKNGQIEKLDGPATVLSTLTAE